MNGLSVILGGIAIFGTSVAAAPSTHTYAPNSELSWGVVRNCLKKPIPDEQIFALTVGNCIHFTSYGSAMGIFKAFATMTPSNRWVHIVTDVIVDNRRAVDKCGTTVTVWKRRDNSWYYVPSTSQVVQVHTRSEVEPSGNCPHNPSKRHSSETAIILGIHGGAESVTMEMAKHPNID